MLAFLAFSIWPGLAATFIAGASIAIAIAGATLATGDVLAMRGASLGLQDGAAAIEHDPAPCLITDADGMVAAQNRASSRRLGDRMGETAMQALSGLLINAAAVVMRQEAAARETGHASEMVFTRNGHLRLSTHPVGSGLLWRLDDADTRVRVKDEIALPMLLASQNGTILSMNAAMEALLGKRLQSVDSVFGEAEIASGARLYLRGVAGPVPVTIIEKRLTDDRREIYALPDEDLQTGRQVPAELFETMPFATLLIRSDGMVQEHNGAARKLLGIRPDEDHVAIGDLVEGPGRLAREWIKDILEKRATNRSEIVRTMRGAEEGSVKITLALMPGTIEPRLLACLQDATDAQDLQTQFAQAQKMQAIGELAGGVAHDFNNLLTAITGHCDLLLLRHDQGDQDYADLVQIHQNANRAASLVGQLLAFSRKQTMKPELLDLRETMADLTHLLNRLVGERITLELRQDPALQPIWADRRLLDQVLMNLVVNARDAMPDGGLISITSRMVRLETELRRNSASVQPGSYVVIDVADRGVGIPEDRVARIFEPFFTTKKVGEGTGLGLSMAYGIMKQSGGYIFCDSTEGEGTCFSLYFPAHDWPAEDQVADPAPAAAGSAEPGARSSDSGVILLVEDEAPVRAFASRALRLKGYSVLEAENGEEALDVLTDDELEIDVFVTDMIMPGKGGPDWVREALVTRPDVGVVFTSGYAEDAYGKFPDIPQAVFLAKPFSLADLTETVAREMR